MNGSDEVIQVLREVVTELRGIREAIESMQYGEDEGYEDEEDEEEDEEQ